MLKFADYAKIETSSVIERLTNIKSDLNIVFIPDLHYKYIDEMRVSVSNIVNSVNTVNKTHKIDCVVLGGDNIGNYPESRDEHIKMTDELANYLDFLDVPWFCVLGNHDDNSIHCTDNPGLSAVFKHGNEVTTKEQYDHLFSRQIKYGYIKGYEEFPLYGYYDVPNKNYRLLFLDSFDLPDIVENGQLIYGRQWKGAYSDNQLNWLIHTALSDDCNKDIIIFKHTPLSIMYDPNSDIDIYNEDALIEILNSYINGTSLYKTGSDNNRLNYEIKAEYKNTHNIKALITGHIHSDSHGFTDNILNITTNCACRDPKGLGTDEKGNHLFKIPYSRNETCYDIYCFNDEEINLIRYGTGEDRKIRLHP